MRSANVRASQGPSSAATQRARLVGLKGNKPAGRCVDFGMASSVEANNGPGLRLWPGVVLVVLIALSASVVPALMEEPGPIGILGPAIGGLLIGLWWLLFSRAPWVERLGAIALAIGAIAATSRLVHISIATAGMGYLLPLLAIPVIGVALVVWAAATRNLSTTARRASMAVVLVLAPLSFTLILSLIHISEPTRPY